MHERRRIRELVVQILTDDAQSLFKHAPIVTNSPVGPIITKRQGDIGLQIHVFLDSDVRVGEGREKQDPCVYLRESVLELQCIVQASQLWVPMIAADGFAEEVEAVLAKYVANNLNNSVQAFEYAETEVQLSDEDGELVYAAAVLKYDVQFRTTAWEVHPELEGVDIEYELKDGDGETHLDPPHAVDTADIS